MAGVSLSLSLFPVSHSLALFLPLSIFLSPSISLYPSLSLSLCGVDGVESLTLSASIHLSLSVSFPVSLPLLLSLSLCLFSCPLSCAPAVGLSQCLCVSVFLSL